MSNTPATPGGLPPGMRLVRIRCYLTGYGWEVLPERRYLKTVDLCPEHRPGLEVYLDDLLEQIAVEHRDERPPADYRLQLVDEQTGEVVLDWRYSRSTGQNWWAL